MVVVCAYNKGMIALSTSSSSSFFFFSSWRVHTREVVWGHATSLLGTWRRVSQSFCARGVVFGLACLGHHTFLIITCPTFFCRVHICKTNVTSHCKSISLIILARRVKTYSFGSTQAQLNKFVMWEYCCNCNFLRRKWSKVCVARRSYPIKCGEFFG